MIKKSMVLGLTLFAGMTLAEEITIKFSHVVAESTPKGQAALKFKELIESRSPDMKVEVYPNSQLFNDDTVLKAMLLGDVQVAAPSLSKFSRFTPKLQVFDLPFLFKDMDAVNRFQNGEVGQSLLTSMEGKGLVGLGYIHNGLKQISANEPILVPADAKGKKFRIQTSDVLEEQFKAVGGIPVKKPFSEVFTLLQTRAVDGTENPWANIYSKKFFEVQTDISETNNGLLDYMVVTSKKFLDSLTDEQRKVFTESMKEAVEYGNNISYDITARDRQAVIDSGVSRVRCFNG